MKLDNFWLGAILGLLAPVITLFGIYLYEFDSLSVIDFFRFIENMGITMQVLSFATMPSFLLFFIFYYAHHNRSAQGVVGASLILTFALVIYSSL